MLSTILSKLHWCPSRDEVTSKYWHWNSITKLEAWTWFQVLQRPLNISFSDLKVHNFTAWLFPAVGQQWHLYELFLPKTEVWHFLRFSPCLVSFPKSENCPFLLHSLCLVIRKRQYTRPCYLRIKWLKLLALKLQYIGIYKPMGRGRNIFFFFAIKSLAFVGRLCWHKSSIHGQSISNKCKIPSQMEVALQRTQKLYYM